MYIQTYNDSHLYVRIVQRHSSQMIESVLLNSLLGLTVFIPYFKSTFQSSILWDMRLVKDFIQYLWHFLGYNAFALLVHFNTNQMMHTASCIISYRVRCHVPAYNGPPFFIIKLFCHSIVFVCGPWIMWGLQIRCDYLITWQLKGNFHQLNSVHFMSHNQWPGI